ncbi:MAG TPA: hypothetical protein VKY53_05830 [Marinobacter sp.]|nr:hypothetical protein [Marinobacter sp.]
MTQPPAPGPEGLRKPLLVVEFSSLAVLLLSMFWLSNTDQQMAPAWLLIPALASLGVFLSFIGLMYLRWIVAVAGRRKRLHQIIFALLTLTLLGVWLYGIASTWLSLTATS